MILLAAAAVVLLMLGVYRATRPTSALLTPAQAQTQIEELAARFSAAIENERDVRPLLEQVRPIVGQQPTLRDGQKLLGQIYAQLGEIGKAYDAFSAALTIDGVEPQLQNLAGTAAMMRGDVAAAETHHLLAVKQVPDDAGLLLPLADVYLKTRRWDEARGVLLRAMELQPTAHAPHAAMSDMFAGRAEDGDLTLAIDQMEKALAKMLSTPETAAQRLIYARKLARLYGLRDEPMEAIVLLDSLPEAARNSPGVLADMAKYLDENGQPVLAGLQYETALAANPAAADYAAKAARWYLKGGDVAAARVMLARLVEIDPRHEAVGELRGEVEN